MGFKHPPYTQLKRSQQCFSFTACHVRRSSASFTQRPPVRVDQHLRAHWRSCYFLSVSTCYSDPSCYCRPSVKAHCPCEILLLSRDWMMKRSLLFSYMRFSVKDEITGLPAHLMILIVPVLWKSTVVLICDFFKVFIKGLWISNVVLESNIVQHKFLCLQYSSFVHHILPSL